MKTIELRPDQIDDKKQVVTLDEPMTEVKIGIPFKKQIIRNVNMKEISKDGKNSH